MTDRVGQIGLGSLGREFVPHLVRRRGSLTVFDLDAARVRAAQAQGAVGAASPRALAQRSDVILLSLPDPDAVRAVLSGDDGVLAGAAPGAMVVDTTTGDPASARAFFHASRERGVAFMEAPVSTPIAGKSGPDAARTGEATFLAGGEPAAFERAGPILSCLGRHVFHVGPIGHGSAMKLVTNYIAGATRVALAEGLALAAAMGIPAERAVEYCRCAAAASQTLEEFAQKAFNGDLDETSFSIALRYKDFRLTSELARQEGVPMLLNGVIVELYQMMLARGMGQRDINNVVPFVAELAGRDVFAGKPLK